MDTGAQVTMIPWKVVNEVGLQPVGHVSIMPVTGATSPVGKVLFEDWIWNWDSALWATKYDELFGMNFLFGFHITMYGNNYILSNWRSVIGRVSSPITGSGTVGISCSA